MAEFKRDNLSVFLGVVRKYMQVRGSLSQKDLAESTGIGVSTMSRFLSQKTADINPQVVAKICASLDIPLHEMIDFVEEDFTDRFIKLVKFYKDSDVAETGVGVAKSESVASEPVAQEDTSLEDALVDTLSSGTAQKTAMANVKIGGKSTTVPFTADEGGKNSQKTMKEKLAALTPRQKAYMSDFLSLDMEGRDLIVDLGNDLFRYFRQKGMIN